jgi:hypothetical protein
MGAKDVSHPQPRKAKMVPSGAVSSSATDFRVPSGVGKPLQHPTPSLNDRPGPACSPDRSRLQRAKPQPDGLAAAHRRKLAMFSIKIGPSQKLRRCNARFSGRCWDDNTRALSDPSSGPDRSTCAGAIVALKCPRCRPRSGSYCRRMACRNHTGCLQRRAKGAGDR